MSSAEPIHPSIVLVEHDDRTRPRHAQLLRRAGFHVVERSTADHIVALLTKEKPDLLLLDCVLPGENGFVACARIKAAPSLRNTRVVILSSQSTFDDVRHANESGAQRILAKPLTVESVLRLFASVTVTPEWLPVR